MSAKLRSHIRGNVVGYVALFIALSGTAYAANTVGSSDVIDDTLLSRDLKDNAGVRSRDVADDTLSSGGLGAVDLAPNSVGASELQNGPLPNSNVVARPQGSSSVSTGDGAPVAYPLSSNTWTQAANESDSVLGGQVSFDAPADPPCDPNDPDDGGHGILGLLVDGELLDTAFLRDDPDEPGLSNTMTFGLGGLLFEPGSADSHTLTAEISDNCAPGKSFTVTSLKVNVIGFR